MGRFAGRPLAFGKYVMPAMFTKPSPDFHYDIASDFIQRKKYPKACYIAPRGHAKSSVVGGVLPLYHIFEEDPGKPKFVLLLAKTGGHPQRLLQTITDCIEYSPNFRREYGYWGRYSARKWRDDFVILKDGTMIMARGTGQQVIGLKSLHQRPTLIVADDLEDIENTSTAERMEKNLEWLLRQLVPTRDIERARVIVIGTPQHQNCMVENLARFGDWHTRRYSALLEDDTKILWPGGPWTLEMLLAEKKAAIDNGRLSYFMREYQCLVTTDEQDRLHEPKHYDGALVQEYGEQFIDLVTSEGTRRVPVNVFIGIDPATSISERADYTAIVPVAVDKERNFYVLPYVRRRMRPSETISEILRLNRQLRPRGVAIEATAAQETFRDILRNHESEHIPGLNRKILPRERKEKKYLDVLEPLLYRGKVLVLRSMVDMKNEILSYGPLRSHDDLLDALYYAIRYAYPPSHEVVGVAKVDQRQKQVRESWAIA